jgi:hypothetical protein
MSLTYHHEYLPPVLPSCHFKLAPACHHLPLVSPEHSDNGEEKPRALNGSEHFPQEPHYIHDETIDASPFHCSEDDVSIIPNTKEFKENVVARSKIKLLSPTEEALHV